MPTKADIKRLSKNTKLKVRKGDLVMIISGKDKGQTGFVAAVSPKEQKVIILRENEENLEQPIPLNAAVKHRKARTNQEKSARYKIPVPIHVSNVMVLDPKTQLPTRVGRRKEGDTVVRFGKKSGEKLIDQEAMEKKA